MKLFNWGRRDKQPAQEKRKRTPPRFNQRLFESAKPDRMSMEWGTTPLTADDIIAKNWMPVVARSQEQVANNDYAKTFVRLCRQNIIGQNGIQLNARSKNKDGTLDKESNDAIQRTWKDFCKSVNVDITGKKSMREFQNQAVNSLASTGEFIARKVYGKEAGKYGFSIQAVAAQRIPVDMIVDRVGGGNNFIRFGIEYTQYGRPVAYYFKTLMSDSDRYMYDGNPYVRVPADDVIHVYREEMTGQRRGLPWLATSLYRMRQMNGMDQAALVNARTGAAKLGWITFDNESDGPEYDENDPPIVDIEPGEMGILPMGASVEKWDPQYPSGEYSSFVKNQLRGVAAGLGVSYHNLAQDLEGVNFSSIRQGTLDERETWKDLQEWFCEEFLQPVFDAWLPRALLSGLIKKSNGGPLNPVMLEKYQEIIWQPRRWDWIDPVSDVKANVSAKNAMLKSPSQLIRDSGQDPDDVINQIAQDIQNQLAVLKKAGLSDKNAENLVMSGYAVDPKMMVEENAQENAGSSSNSNNSGK